MPHKKIPTSEGMRIARLYNCDQVIIITRKIGVGDEGCENVMTYGKDKENCAAAAQIGEFMKYNVMGWKKDYQ